MLPHRSHSDAPAAALAVAAVVLCVLAGCGCALVADPLGALLGRDEASSLADPAAVVWDADAVTIVDALQTVFDVDVFDLGPLPAGTRLTVEVVGADGLDPVAAVFDAEENRFAFADDVDFPNGQLDAIIDEVVRHDSERYLLAISGFGIAPKPATAGTYTARLTRSAVGAPVPVGHTIVIRFQGGSGVFVDDEILGRLGPWDVPAFDAAALIPGFADEYDAIKPAIAAAAQRVFADYDLTVLTDDDPLPDEPVSSVYLVYDVDAARAITARGIFGVAYGDLFNRMKDESIFVFVEPLAARSATADVFIHLVANMAAHEIGHAVGLLHVSVTGSLMAPTLPLGACCRLSTLQRGPMVEFPIGHEDPAILLTDTLGPRR